MILIFLINHFFCIAWTTSNLINSSHGKPCKKVSNQSIAFMPIAPPHIHFNFPQRCGSGKKGAIPRVRQATRINDLLLIIDFIIGTKVINLYIQSRNSCFSELNLGKMNAVQFFTFIIKFEDLGMMEHSDSIASNEFLFLKIINCFR